MNPKKINMMDRLRMSLKKPNQSNQDKQKIANQQPFFNQRKPQQNPSQQTNLKDLFSQAHKERNFNDKFQKDSKNFDFEKSLKNPGNQGNGRSIFSQRNLAMTSKIVDGKKMTVLDKINLNKKKNEKEVNEAFLRKNKWSEPQYNKPSDATMVYRNLPRNKRIDGEQLIKQHIQNQEKQKRILKNKRLEEQKIKKQLELKVNNQKEMMMKQARYFREQEQQKLEDQKRWNDQKIKDLEEKEQKRLACKNYDKMQKELMLKSSLNLQDDLKFKMSAEVIQRKRNIDQLVDSLLSTCFTPQKSKVQGPTDVIPNNFTNSRHYLNSFLPSFFHECHAKMEKSVQQLSRSIHRDPEYLTCSMEYLQHETDRFRVFKLEDIDGQQYFLHRRNMVVLLSDSNSPDLSTVNSSTPNNEGHFSILGLVVKKEVSSRGLQIMISNRSCGDALYKATRSLKKIHVFSLGKITTELREYIALTNLEYQIVAPLIIDPRKIGSTNRRKHNVEEFSTILNQIEGLFNVSQMSAIEEICRSKDGVCLLQGPPGTGKTHTLLGVVAGLIDYIRNSDSNIRKQIMICTPSNYSIDEIIMRLQNKGILVRGGNIYNPKIVRMGVMDKIKHPSVMESCLSVIAEKELNKRTKSKGEITQSLKNELLIVEESITKLSQTQDQQAQVNLLQFKAKKQEILGKLVNQKMSKYGKRALMEEIEETILREADIICCTLNSSGSEKLDRLESGIETLIIDEAGQCTEPENLIPLRFKASKIVLIGDPKQLPATTFGNTSQMTLYSRSLFERIAESGTRVNFLTTQYRMLPEIRLFPSKTFYRGRLKDSKFMNSRTFPPKLEFLKKGNNNIVFFNTKNSMEKRNMHSYYNEEEITICSSILRALAQGIKDINANTVAVISPYKEQVRRLQDIFSSQIENGQLEVNTVDAFQGQEKDIIIFSSVRSNHNRNVGFLRDTRRLNVGLTRAKYGLFVVGNSKTLSADPTWNSFISHMQVNDNIVDFSYQDEVFRLLRKMVTGIHMDRTKISIDKPKIPYQKNKNHDHIGKRKAPYNGQIKSHEHQRMNQMLRDSPELKKNLDSEMQNLNSRSKKVEKNSPDMKQESPLTQLSTKNPSTRNQSPNKKRISTGLSGLFQSSNPDKKISLNDLIKKSKKKEKPKIDKLRKNKQKPLKRSRKAVFDIQSITLNNSFEDHLYKED